MPVPDFTKLNLSSLIGAPRSMFPGSSPVDAYGTVVPGAAPIPGVTTPGPGLSVGPSGALPPYLLQQTATGLSSDLSGEVPLDVQQMLEQQAAEYGVGSGTQGSQFAGYRGLRNLGLTSLDLRRHAQDVLAGQFTNPAEQSKIDLANRGFEEGRREFGITQNQKDREYQTQLDLAKQKFASEQNALQRDFQLKELQALGLKYGGGGVVSASGGGGNIDPITGMPIRNYFYGGENGPGPLQRLF